MRANERFAAFVVLPAMLALGPVIAPLVVHYGNGTLKEVTIVPLLREIGESLFLWTIVGSIYLVFLWSQPPENIPPAHKTKLLACVSALAIAGLFGFAFVSP